MKKQMAIINANLFSPETLYTSNSNSSIYIVNGKIETIDQVSASYLPDGCKIIDAQGAFLMPAFIEGHGHFSSLGLATFKINLFSCKSWMDVIELVKEKAVKLPKGTWIEGEGWHQEKWNNKNHLYEGYPEKELLDKYIPDHPVALFHASRHSAIVNQHTLDLLGWNTSTYIEGGDLIKKDAELSGMLIENAIEPVRDLLKAYYVEKQIPEKALLKANEICFENGITSFHDADTNFTEVSRIENLQKKEANFVNLYMMLHETLESLQQNKNQVQHLTTDRLTVQSIKRYMDGAIGNRGAWFFEDYSDADGNKGHCTLDIDEYYQTAKFALENNFQLCTHAIGDRANYEVLKCYNETLNTSKNARERRWRIEHSQHIRPQDIEAFVKNNILASVQTNHCTSDASYVEKRVGKERLKTSYLWKTFLNKRIHLNNGTDCPIEKVSPLLNIYSAISRKNDQGIGFNFEERLNIQEAISSYTIWNAYAAFQENYKGQLQKGFQADLVLLDKDLIHTAEKDPNEIKSTQILMTISNGEIVYNNL